MMSPAPGPCPPPLQPLSAATLVYAGAACALRVSETTEAPNLIRRRLLRRRTKA